MLKNLLLHWYARNRRSFPWREKIFKNKEEHAYHVWICEVMSQQTLLSVLIPKYEVFLSELPNVISLYNCSEEKLRNLWKGLGYYARARNLKKGAHYIVHECKNIFPKTQIEWEKVPGCGAYTAAVIASVCYDEKVASVDGNAIRVASRLLNLQDSNVWTSQGHKKILDFLTDHISDKNPGDFNQAVMDLGATLCNKHNPNCAQCPLNNLCLAYQSNTTHLCPPVKHRREKITKNVYVFIVKNPDNKTQIAITERKNGFLKNTVGFPLSTQKNNFSLSDLRKLIHNRGGQIKILQNTFQHSITHYNITGFVVLIDCKEQWFETSIRWVAQSNLKESLSSSLDQKAYKLFLSME